MSKPADVSDYTQNVVDPIEPLEPGRPDIMPNPASIPERPIPENDHEAVDPDEEASEEGMSDVAANNSFMKEHPGEI
jgi:hypothetical protein